MKFCSIDLRNRGALLRKPEFLDSPVGHLFKRYKESIYISSSESGESGGEGNPPVGRPLFEDSRPLYPSGTHQIRCPGSTGREGLKDCPCQCCLEKPVADQA